MSEKLYCSKECFALEIFFIYREQYQVCFFWQKSILSGHPFLHFTFKMLRQWSWHSESWDFTPSTTVNLLNFVNKVNLVNLVNMVNFVNLVNFVNFFNLVNLILFSVSQLVQLQGEDQLRSIAEKFHLWQLQQKHWRRLTVATTRTWERRKASIIIVVVVITITIMTIIIIALTSWGVSTRMWEGKDAERGAREDLSHSGRALSSSGCPGWDNFNSISFSIILIRITRLRPEVYILFRISPPQKKEKKSVLYIVIITTTDPHQNFREDFPSFNLKTRVADFVLRRAPAGPSIMDFPLSSHLTASRSLWMGTLTGKLVASKKSVIRFLWMISVWIGRTSWTEEETEERREEREEAGHEMDEEVDWGEPASSRGEGRSRGRRRNSNMSPPRFSLLRDECLPGEVETATVEEPRSRSWLLFWPLAPTWPAPEIDLYMEFYMFLHLRCSAAREESQLLGWEYPLTGYL